MTATYRGAPLEYAQHPGEGWCRRLRGILHADADGGFSVELAPFGDPKAVNYADCFIAVYNEGVKEGDRIRVELRYPCRLADILR